MTAPQDVTTRIAGEPALAGTPAAGLARALEEGVDWSAELAAELARSRHPSTSGRRRRVSRRPQVSGRSSPPPTRAPAAPPETVARTAPPRVRPPATAPVVDPITAEELERRLAARRRHPAGRARHRPPRRRTTTAPTMGYQPGLDGLRAVSVIVIMLYHAGFAWIHGGFFAVELFFATSGFLITTLLLEEQERRRRISLPNFWKRRARRLLPALAVLLATVAVVTLLAGTDDQLTTLRRDFPWAIFYASNWGQILGDIPYWAADPPLLRHLWTLAIEEQFYLLWPLAFVALSRRGRATAVRALVALAAAAMLLAFVIHAAGPGPMGGLFDGADRVNFNYLSTGTRAGALLLGSAAAYVWQPWRTARRLTPPARARVGRLLDRTGGALIGLFACVAATAVITEGYVYQWLLGVMTLVATGLVLIVVHPAATGMQRIFGWKPLAEIGKRSYGLYLWHWPVFVFAGAIHGEVGPFLVSMLIAAVLSEICYRYVETPVRNGTFGGWWGSTTNRSRGWFLSIAVTVVVVLVGAYALVEPKDRAVGGEQVTFTLPPAMASSTTTAPVAPVDSAAVAPPAVASTATTAAPVTGPLRVTIVGDSQGHSLAVNQPQGIGETFAISNGALPGCSIYDAGSIRTARPGVRNNFGMCEGWAEDWADAVRDHGAEVALVVLGAWDVFDLETPDGEVLTFGSPAWDAYVSGNLQHRARSIRI